MKTDFACYHCQSDDFVVVADQSSIRFNCYGFHKSVVQCAQCGLVQLFPQWTENELKDLYQTYSKKKDFEGFKPKKSITRYLRKYILPTDAILEVGCGTGDNVRMLRKADYNIVGIDRDPTVCDGEMIQHGDFEANESAGLFDFIYAIQVLEHVSAPARFLGKILSRLQPKGRFLLELPNVNDPLLTIYRNKAFNSFYWYPYHLFFFNEKSIKSVLDKLPQICKVNVKLYQRYGLINHLRWICLGRPGNLNFHIPVLDDIYKFILTRLMRRSDTLIVEGTKNSSAITN